MIARINRTVRFTVLQLLPLALFGCTTFISSKPAEVASTGFRYSLPIPVLEVVPQKDGTIKTDVIYLKDPDNTYVYSARSFVSSYTLQIEREPNGLLKKVTMDAKSADVASEAAKAAGEIAKSEINAAKEEAKEENEEKEAREQAAKAARDAIRDKELAVSKAAEKLSLLRAAAADPPSEAEQTKIFEAELELRLAELERDAAITNATEDFGDLLDSGRDTPSGGPVAYGPVYYRIEMKEKSVSLVPLVYLDGEADTPKSKPTETNQKEFKTSTDAIPKQKIAAAAKPRLFLLGDAVISTNDNGRFRFDVKVEGSGIKKLASVHPLRKRGADDRLEDVTNVTATINLSDAGKTIVVNFPAEIAAGRYILTLRYHYGPKNVLDATPISFEISK